jgi:hypothetical protein
MSLTRVTNIYAPYKLQTPSKVTASFAYVLGASGASIRHENYGNTTFKPENDSYFSGQNANMSNTLDNLGS